MTDQWKPLELIEEGRVLNTFDHDSVLQAIYHGGPDYLRIAWKTEEGDIHAVRFLLGSYAMVFASGLTLPCIINSVYLWTADQQEPEREWASDAMGGLRKEVQTYLGSPDWLLEFEMCYGGDFLVGGKGSTDMIQTAKLEKIEELFSD